MRGECKFQGCCAQSLRVAATVPGAADSGYEPAESNDCTEDGSSSDTGCSGEKWESGSKVVLREGLGGEWRVDRCPPRRVVIRESIYRGRLQQSGGRYKALINDGGPDDALLCRKAEGFRANHFD